MEKKIIQIACPGAEKEDIRKLVPFEKSFKSMTVKGYNKLRISILKYGMRIPVFVWNNIILDGSQRLRILMDLIGEGYDIKEIPVVRISAKDRAEAEKVYLLINSQYGKITERGFEKFVEELDIKRLAEVINLTNVNLFNVIDEWAIDFYKFDKIQKKGSDMIGLIRIKCEKSKAEKVKEAVIRILKKRRFKVNIA